MPTTTLQTQNIANKKKPAKTGFYKTSFSRPQLIAFILIFAAIGGYILYRTFAAAPLVATLEAEQMSLPSGGTVLNDTTASSGKAVLLSTDGTATGTVNFPSSVNSVSVIAKGIQCSGSPVMNVKLDGANLLANTSVSSTSWSAYSVTPSTALTSGSHTLSITASNLSTVSHGSSKKNACSRQLYLDVSNFYGPVVTNPAPTVSLSATPTAVTAGTASTLTWNSTNATSCSASGAWSGARSTAGSASTGAINQNSTYTLTCTGPGGSASASAMVAVNTSGFTTSLTNGMTITPPYTWTFNPGETSVTGYFWADGIQLGTASPDSKGGYSFTIQSGTLTAGTHILGHAWDLADGTHKIAPSAYTVTIAGAGGTSGMPVFAPPAFTPTTTVSATSPSDFRTKVNQLVAGELLNVPAMTIPSEVAISVNPSSYAEVHFASGVKFTGDAIGSKLPAVWVHDSSNVRFYGADVTGGGNDGIRFDDDTNILWWDFNVHDTAGTGVTVRGITHTTSGIDMRGTIYHCGLADDPTSPDYDLSLDPHGQKGTGNHAFNMGTGTGQLVTNSRFVLTVHDQPYGAAVEAESSQNIQFYLDARRITGNVDSTGLPWQPAPYIQVAGNPFQFWGDNTKNFAVKYLYADTLGGRGVDVGDGLNSTNSGITVEYARVTNARLTPVYQLDPGIVTYVDAK